MSNIDHEDGVVLHEHFDASKDEMWATITDPDELAAWLGGRCRLEPTVGGAIHFDLPDDGVVANGVIREWHPPDPARTLAGFEHTFVDETRPDELFVCGWWIIPTDGGCDLRFTLESVDDTPANLGPWAQMGARLGSPTPSRPETSVADAVGLLRSAKEILLVDWVTKDIPKVLVEAGFSVVSKNGPGADDYGRAAVVDGELVFTHVDPPTQADLLHLDWTIDFDEYLAFASSIGVKTFWYHSAKTKPPAPADVSGCWVPARKSVRLRQAAEAAGMHFIDDRYIVDIARRL